VNRLTLLRMKNDLWGGSGSAGGEETEEQRKEAEKRRSGEAGSRRKFPSPFRCFAVSPLRRMILLSARG